MTAEHDSGFEVYQRPLVAATAQPCITVQKRGLLSLNVEAHRLLGTPDLVELMYDSRRRAIGVRRADTGALHAYPIRRVGTAGSLVISATSFLRHFGIEVDTSRRWVARLESEVLSIDLEAEGTPVTSNRARRQRSPVRKYLDGREG